MTDAEQLRHKLGDKVYRPNMVSHSLFDEVEIYRIMIDPCGVYYQTDEKDSDGKQSWRYNHSKSYYDTPTEAVLYLKRIHTDYLERFKKQIIESIRRIEKTDEALKRLGYREGASEA